MFCIEQDNYRTCCQLRRYSLLHSVKLPRGVIHLPTTHSNVSAEDFVEQYLWRLLRRAHVFQSPPIQKFVDPPLSMKQAVASLSKQTISKIRDDRLQYAKHELHDGNGNTNRDGKSSSNRKGSTKWVSLRCVLYTGYIIEGYQLNDNDNDNDDDEKYEEQDNMSSTSTSLEILHFRVDVVEIKRVVRFPKENKFTVHLHRDESFSIRCHNHSTFRDWTEEIKKMINLRGINGDIFCRLYLCNDSLAT